MRNLRRQKLRKFSKQEIAKLVDQLMEFILRLTIPEKVILFGSAVNDTFDEASDLDVIVIFPDKKLAASGRKKLYSDKALADHTVDFICVDAETFREKSNMGGVCLVAAEEGEVIWPRKGPCS